MQYSQNTPTTADGVPQRHTGRRASLLGVVLGGALVAAVVVPGSASAAGPAPADLAGAKAQCIAALELREAEIAKLTSLANGSSTLTDAHEGTIDSFLGSSSAGLAALKVEIEADTDPAALREDCAAVAEDYRIFALRSPQVHLAIGGDREAAALARADALVPRLQDAIDTAAAAGQDVTEAVETMGHLQSTLEHANATLPGVVDTVLGYSPSDWNANHSLLTSATTAIRSVHADLVAAMADGRAIVALLEA